MLFYQQSKQIISKAKQLQQNNRLKNRQNRQTQQRDARQNIINNRRGMQVKGHALLYHIFTVVFLHVRLFVTYGKN